MGREAGCVGCAGSGLAAFLAEAPSVTDFSVIPWYVPIVSMLKPSVAKNVYKYCIMLHRMLYKLVLSFHEFITTVVTLLKLVMATNNQIFVQISAAVSTLPSHQCKWWSSDWIGGFSPGPLVSSDTSDHMYTL